MDFIVSGMITVTRALKRLGKKLSNASSAIEVKVLGIMIDLPSAERRRIASALVNTVILEEEGREGKGVSN